MEHTFHAPNGKPRYFSMLVSGFITLSTQERISAQQPKQLIYIQSNVLPDRGQ